MNESQQLVKAFTKLEHAQNFIQGNIILRELSYFRNQCESKNGDRKEGSIFTKGGSYSSCNPAFVLCMHDENFIDKESPYGTGGKVIIEQPQQIVDQICKVLRDASCTAYTNLESVTYYGNNFDIHNIRWDQLAFYKSKYSSDTCKTKCYADDKEWRIAIMSPTLELIIKHIKVETKYFRIKRLGYKILTEELDYKKWHYSKYNQPSYPERNWRQYEMDDHYHELHFKNILFDSMLIQP